MDSRPTVGVTVWVGSGGVVCLMEVYHCRGLWDYVDSSEALCLMIIGVRTIRNLAKEAVTGLLFSAVFISFHDYQLKQTLK